MKSITQENVFEVISLWDSLDDEQKQSVAPNSISLAQAYANRDCAWPRAIYLDEKVMGFIMLRLYDKDIPDVDQPSYFLWRFMIGKPYQGKGYGKEVLDLIKNKCVMDKIKNLYVTCTMHTPMPYQFYINYGFIDLKETDGEEEVLKMPINW